MYHSLQYFLLTALGHFSCLVFLVLLWPLLFSYLTSKHGSTQGSVLGLLSFLFILTPLVVSSCIAAFQTPLICYCPKVISLALNSRPVNTVAIQHLHLHVSNVSHTHVTKTELLIVFLTPGSSPAVPISVNDNSILIDSQDKNLGVILDSSLSLIPYSWSVNKSCCLHAHSVHTIKPLLTTLAELTIMYLSLIDRSSLLAGFSVFALPPSAQWPE